MCDPSEERHHADDHEGGRLLGHVGKKPVPEAPERGAEHPADDHPWGEDSAGTSRSDRERGGHDLRQGENQDDPEW